MLKVSGENANRTNHIMVRDDKGRIYCHLSGNVVKWSSEWYQEYCTRCQYLSGLGQDIGVIECAFDNGTENISETVTEPFELLDTTKLGIKI